MTNQEAIRLMRNLPTMCEFTDAYGEPIDSDAYYEAVDMAISALQEQEEKTQLSAEGTTNLQPTCNELAKDICAPCKDSISRQAAIDSLNRCTDVYHTNLPPLVDKEEVRRALASLPSAQPERTEIIRCKDCNKASKCYGDVIMRSRGGGNIYCPLEFCSLEERRTE